MQVSFRINPPAAPATQTAQNPENPLPSPPAKAAPSKERVDWNDEMINSLLNFYEEHKGTFHSSTVSTFFTELSEKLGIPGNRISEKFIRLKHQYRVTADNLNKKGGMNPDSIIYKRMDKLFASSKTSPAASVPVSISVSKDISTESTPSIIKTVPAPSNIPSTITGSAISMPISAPNPPANGGMNKIVFSSGRGKDSAISISSKPISISNGNSVITPTPLPPAPKPSFTELSQFTHNFSSKEIHCPPIQSAPQPAPAETSMLFSVTTPLMAPITAINAYTTAPTHIIPTLPPPAPHSTETLNISPLPVVPSSPDELSLRREEAILQKIKHDHELELRKQEQEHAIRMRQLDLAERELSYKEAKLALRREKLKRRWASPTLEPASSRNDGSHN